MLSDFNPTRLQYIVSSNERLVPEEVLHMAAEFLALRQQHQRLRAAVQKVANLMPIGRARALLLTLTEVSDHAE